MIYKNPVISGFNPDPSICKVGEDFYLVTSSFEYFPGVPIYHSKNLVNWEVINYCLTDEEQLKLDNCRCSGGIFAPTIRYHDGIFYMTTTNITDKGNFIVTTKDIYGKWSKPVWIDQGGIDPSLLFDEGRVYFTSAMSDSLGKPAIVSCEIDPKTGKKLANTKVISYGTGGRFCEGPHIYKIGNYFYLLTAEGGTEYGHMVSIQRGDSAYGPFEICPNNPILSHKDSTYQEIQATGHSDLVEDENGNWWLINLGIRQAGEVMLHNLGRETFVSQVTWNKEGWPTVGNGGTISLEMDAQLPGIVEHKNNRFLDDFQTKIIDLNWNYVRNPVFMNYETGNGLTLHGDSETLSDYHPTFLGIRQKEFILRAQAKVSVLSNTGYAGVTAFYNKNYHYDLYLEACGVEQYVILSKSVHDFTAVDQKIKIQKSECIEFMIETGTEEYKFYYKISDEWIYVGKAATAGICTEGTMSMTFTGTFLGVFAVATDAKFSYFKVDDMQR